jgi:hypothetical protein
MHGEVPVKYIPKSWDMAPKQLVRFANIRATT